MLNNVFNGDEILMWNYYFYESIIDSVGHSF